MRHGAVDGPGHMAIRHVTAAIGSNGHQAWRSVAGADKKQAVAEYRTRDYGITIVADAPELMPCFRIVSVDGIAGWTDDLLLPVDANKQGSGERESFEGLDGAVRFPGQPARVCVQGDDAGS